MPVGQGKIHNPPRIDTPHAEPSVNSRRASSRNGQTRFHRAPTRGVPSIRLPAACCFSSLVKNFWAWLRICTDVFVRTWAAATHQQHTPRETSPHQKAHRLDRTTILTARPTSFPATRFSSRPIAASPGPIPDSASAATSTGKPQGAP